MVNIEGEAVPKYVKKIKDYYGAGKHKYVYKKGLLAKKYPYATQDIRMLKKVGGKTLKAVGKTAMAGFVAGEIAEVYARSQEVAKLGNKVAHMQDRIESLDTLFKRGRINKKDYAKRMKSLRRQKETLERKRWHATGKLSKATGVALIFAAGGRLVKAASALKAKKLARMLKTGVGVAPWVSD